SAKLSLFVAVEEAFKLPVAIAGTGVELVHFVPSEIGESKPMPLVGCANCVAAPTPWFRKMVSVLSPWLITARSCAPELRKSALAIAVGLLPTVNCTVGIVTPVPPGFGMNPVDPRLPDSSESVIG